MSDGVFAPRDRERRRSAAPSPASCACFSLERRLEGSGAASEAFEGSEAFEVEAFEASMAAEV